MFSRFNLKENSTWVLKDKDGKTKKLFQENKLAIFLIKLGVLPVRFAKIPFLFGRYVSGKQVANLITNAGLAGVASRINGSGGAAAFTYIALGTGTTAANVTDTTLETEITTGGGERVAATVSLVTTDVTNDTAQLTATFTFTGSFAITESGVLNASSAGTLLARQVFSAINVVSGDLLQVTWRFDID